MRVSSVFHAHDKSTNDPLKPGAQIRPKTADVWYISRRRYECAVRREDFERLIREDWLAETPSDTTISRLAHANGGKCLATSVGMFAGDVRLSQDPRTNAEAAPPTEPIEMVQSDLCPIFRNGPSHKTLSPFTFPEAPRALKATCRRLHIDAVFYHACHSGASIDAALGSRDRNHSTGEMQRHLILIQCESILGDVKFGFM